MHCLLLFLGLPSPDTPAQSLLVSEIRALVTSVRSLRRSELCAQMDGPCVLAFSFT